MRSGELARKPYVQQTIIPNKTPMTKSQTVIATIILIMVIYSDLSKRSGRSVIRLAGNVSRGGDRPGNAVSVIP